MSRGRVPDHRVASAVRIQLGKTVALITSATVVMFFGGCAGQLSESERLQAGLVDVASDPAASSVLTPPTSAVEAPASPAASRPVVMDLGLVTAVSADSGPEGPAGPTQQAPVSIYSGPVTDPETGKPVVYLTIDDGPDPVWTPQILSVLKEHKATATFFMLGLQASLPPSLVEQVEAAGHAVGNHTYGHPVLRSLSDEAIREQVRSTDQALGIRTQCVRPPTGATSSRVFAVLSSMGYSQVLWNVDTQDWMRPGSVQIADQIGSAAPGSIILMHDAGGERGQSVAGLQMGLSRLAAKGLPGAGSFALPGRRIAFGHVELCAAVEYAVLSGAPVLRSRCAGFLGAVRQPGGPVAVPVRQP